MGMRDHNHKAKGPSTEVWLGLEKGFENRVLGMGRACHSPAFAPSTAMFFFFIVFLGCDGALPTAGSRCSYQLGVSRWGRC